MRRKKPAFGDLEVEGNECGVNDLAFADVEKHFPDASEAILSVSCWTTRSR